MLLKFISSCILAERQGSQCPSHSLDRVHDVYLSTKKEAPILFVILQFLCNRMNVKIKK